MRKRMLNVINTLRRDPWILLVVVFAVSIIGAGCKGQEGAAGGVEWSGLILQVIPYLGTILGLVLTWAVMLLIRKMGWSWKEEQIASWIDIVVNWVEEWAAARLKSEGKAPSTDEKRRFAVGLVQEKFPGVDFLDARLHGRLAANGIGAAHRKGRVEGQRAELETFVAKLRAQMGTSLEAQAGATEAPPGAGSAKKGTVAPLKPKGK